MTSTLRDKHHRRINYLRLSVTDRCNLRCSYCMPAEGLAFVERDELLSDQEILAVARAATELGIRKIRVTGGEPLLRRGIVKLLTQISAQSDLDRLVLTTNGLLLPEMAGDLASAGVSGANISIDSLEADRFREITRGGSLDKCLAGIEAALSAGMNTKLNVVVMAGVNDHEAPDFLEFAKKNPVSVRFIEYMPTRGKDGDTSLTLPSADLLARLSALATLEPVERPAGLNLAGPARVFRIAEGKGSIGVISPVSCHFCQDCNRIRVTATGLARGCLFHEDGLDLKPHLRGGDHASLLEALRSVVMDKPEQHGLNEDDDIGPVPMSQVGG